MGPITSGFGQREDPVTGNGEGEFHTGVDISAPIGTPIRATADGIVITAGMENGYGREVIIDHGHGLKTCYGHMSGFNVIAGQTVIRGQIIGFVGHSGRTTGNHLHYEVRIRNTPVNPHKYLRDTLADLGIAVATPGLLALVPAASSSCQDHFCRFAQRGTPGYYLLNLSVCFYFPV